MIPDQLIDILEEMENFVPRMEGSISARIFSSLSGYFILEMWGVDVAEAKFGIKTHCEMYLDRKLAMEFPDRIHELEEIVSNINKVIEKHRI